MHWKTKGQLAGLALLAGAFMSVNGAMIYAGSAGPAAPPTQYVAHSIDISGAEAVAKSKFQGFLAHIDTNAVSHAAVKVATGPSDAAVWVTEFQPTAKGFAGTVVSDGAIYRAGDVIAFSTHQVRDWSFIGRDGKLCGNYITRALLPHLPNAQAVQVATVLSTIPAPW